MVELLSILKYISRESLCFRSKMVHQNKKSKRWNSLKVKQWNSLRQTAVEPVNGYFKAEFDRFLISKGVGDYGTKAGEWSCEGKISHD